MVIIFYSYRGSYSYLVWLGPIVTEVPALTEHKGAYCELESWHRLLSASLSYSELRSQVPSLN